MGQDDPPSSAVERSTGNLSVWVSVAAVHMGALTRNAIPGLLTIAACGGSAQKIDAPNSSIRSIPIETSPDQALDVQGPYRDPQAFCQARMVAHDSACDPDARWYVHNEAVAPGHIVRSLRFVRETEGDTVHCPVAIQTAIGWFFVGEGIEGGPRCRDAGDFDYRSAAITELDDGREALTLHWSLAGSVGKPDAGEEFGKYTEVVFVVVDAQLHFWGAVFPTEVSHEVVRADAQVVGGQAATASLDGHGLVHFQLTDRYGDGFADLAWPHDEGSVPNAGLYRLAPMVPAEK